MKSFVCRYPITLLIIAVAIALAAAAPARAGMVSMGSMDVALAPVFFASIAAPPTPVPETGSTLALFVSAAAAFLLFRRRFVSAQS